MINAEWLYWLCGLLFLACAVFVARAQENPKRVGSAIFWALIGVSFFYSTFVVKKTAPAWPLGLAVLATAALAGFRAMGDSKIRTTLEAQREKLAARFGSRLLLLALVIPAVAVLVAMVVAKVHVGGKLLLADGTATLTGLGAGSLVAVGIAMLVLRRAPAEVAGARLTPAVPLGEGSRLLQAIGWAAILPQMLATLGVLFDKAGVGKAVGKVTNAVLPHGWLLGAVIIYCVGMALFTLIMGNAFAAFPVMTAAIGWPVLVQQFHGNPAAVFAIGMLAGFCGTLCTPMAANFNIVPAVLLEMKDKYGPIKAQLPTAVPLLACNIAIMYLVAF